jgi:hypothetical protein
MQINKKAKINAVAIMPNPIRNTKISFLTH